jgi:hypothetical protein
MDDLSYQHVTSVTHPTAALCKQIPNPTDTGRKSATWNKEAVEQNLKPKNKKKHYLTQG